ncbi:MAG: hypothetical protein JO125_03735 [Chloroflexi bacterium]|nr:hypothetical protein [Ktedonobacteraceae bacterium]MBV8822832.1 hypothetical protein [Ktedonobacteraceae bacterium]MBV9021039.1 hypothetical protein [Ktedonobacteraceae bacterium]MBV9706501.1 hypothetical protein [Chloroflexota bacterium]
MKYQVTCRLTHPNYLPATVVTFVDAHTHCELDTALAKVTVKWQARGYIVRITKVIGCQRA